LYFCGLLFCFFYLFFSNNLFVSSKMQHVAS
jgi:hypothetical protein